MFFIYRPPSLSLSFARASVALRRSVALSTMTPPTVKDFSMRPRAETSRVPSHQSFVDLEAQPQRRHSTEETSHAAPPPKSPQSSLGPPSRRVSVEGLRRRSTRAHTVRNYQTSTRPHWEEPGAEPGVDTARDAAPHLGTLQQQCDITVVDFSDEQMTRAQLNNDTLDEFLQAPKPDWVACRWININGLSWDVIKTLGNYKSLHRLAIEDLMNTRGRTKADWYSDQAYGECPCSEYSADIRIAWITSFSALCKRVFVSQSIP